MKAIADGSPHHLICGPVWQGLPQTSAAVEHVGFGVLHSFARPSTHAYGDSKTVVDSAAAPISWQLKPSSLYGGVFRDIIGRASKNVASVTWIKAHVLDSMSAEEIEQMPSEEREHALGNSYADADAAADRG